MDKRKRPCQIVTRDWLKDSITKKKRLPEKPFSFIALLKEQKAREQKKAKTAKGLQQADAFVNTSKCG
jgi:hypothetical protein